MAVEKGDWVNGKVTKMNHKISFQLAVLAHEVKFKTEIGYDDNGNIGINNKFCLSTQSELREWLLNLGINVMPFFYESGSYSFKIFTHNGDSTGWTKVGFMNPTFYSINEAMEEGLKEGVRILIETKNINEKTKIIG